MKNIKEIKKRKSVVPLTPPEKAVLKEPKNEMNQGQGFNISMENVDKISLNPLYQVIVFFNFSKQ